MTINHIKALRRQAEIHIEQLEFKQYQLNQQLNQLEQQIKLIQTRLNDTKPSTGMINPEHLLMQLSHLEKQQIQLDQLNSDKQNLMITIEKLTQQRLEQKKKHKIFERTIDKRDIVFKQQQAVSDQHTADELALHTRSYNENWVN